MAGAQPSRLNRLLAMVPYFQARRGISIEQAARELGVTQTQLTKDLELLFVCGLPGYYPDDLIELEFSEGFVNVGFTAGMDRPLRLTTVEASTLLVALRALVETPGVVDVAAARRAIAKIEEAVGATAVPGLSGAGTESEAAPGENPTFTTVREAVRRARALRLNYYSASRDSVTERVVDPIRLQVMDQHTYLEAWCRMAEGVRLFRFDRIDTAVALDEPSNPPAEAESSSQSVLVPENPDLPAVELDIDPDHLWILDYYPVEPVTSISDRDPQAPVRARMVYGSPEWLTRLLLGFGGAVRVVDDPGVAAAVVESAASARERYR
ncbi:MULTISPECIES: helix-turn-helix transcriptional regulator [Gordonia]|uniref:WYL domain-containing protein n=1 Tax=Gordonia amicalis TaxID=89053 RepID=A0AAE4RAI1_9ACTN|nr:MULTISPECIES: WYL domain-containing protein [Gordonia]ATD70901.1 protein pafC [Gordonia sp. 1D]MCZ0913146.1 WYL domain-containing protein [Gordonia amicalis]MCZ4580289.1 WYL domain-containing protein [Gordonia amicalis]MCZ4653121.1 WYL domain-containing protein [Gordonia amicalis]MDJ0451048.1 WYL domain-containing protein [Gordonia amicalis]